MALTSSSGVASIARRHEPAPGVAEHDQPVVAERNRPEEPGVGVATPPRASWSRSRSGRCSRRPCSTSCRTDTGRRARTRTRSAPTCRSRTAPPASRRRSSAPATRSTRTSCLPLISPNDADDRGRRPARRRGRRRRCRTGTCTTCFHSVYGAGMRTSVQMPFRWRMPQSDLSAPVEGEVADARVLLQQRRLAASPGSSRTRSRYAPLSVV